MQSEWYAGSWLALLVGMVVAMPLVLPDSAWVSRPGRLGVVPRVGGAGCACSDGQLEAAQPGSGSVHFANQQLHSGDLCAFGREKELTWRPNTCTSGTNLATERAADVPPVCRVRCCRSCPHPDHLPQVRSQANKLQEEVGLSYEACPVLQRAEYRNTNVAEGTACLCRFVGFRSSREAH